MICIDANVWISFFDAELSEHEDVRDPLADVLEHRPIFQTTVLQMEVVHYLEKQLSDSETATRRFLDLEDTTAAALTSDDVARAAEILSQHGPTGIGGRDATVIAAMERCDVTELWTHDSGLDRLGDRLDWLEVVDPVSDRPRNGS